MERQHHAARLAAEIRNAAWMVRHYRRNQARRDQAVKLLGLTLRRAFNDCDDFEALLTALVEALTPDTYKPPF